MKGQCHKSDDSLSSPHFLKRLEEEKLTALADFAAGAGHEINNPLAIIGGRAQLLLEKNTSPDDRRHLGVIIAQVRRAYEMIADLRLFSRPPEPVSERIDLKAFFDRLVTETLSRFPDWKGVIRFSWNADTTAETLPDSLVTDPGMLRSIFDALIQNSVEAIGPEKKGTILITGDLIRLSETDSGEGEISIPESHRQTEPDESTKPLSAYTDRIRFLLEDDGPGIVTELREHLFSPYFSGRSHGRGLGFGLSRGWAFARRLGGDLYLDPQTTSSQTARFILDIPLRDEF